MDVKPHIIMRRHRSYSFTSFRRLRRLSAFRFSVLLCLVWDSLHAVSLCLNQQVALDAPPPPQNTKRIYIAAQHWNTARVLRSHWNAALHALVQELGIDNVFVSIYESGSYDDTKDALRELDSTLEKSQVKRSIILSDISHADEMTRQPADHGWIKTPNGETELRRIPFLSSIRNRIFEPLEALRKQGEEFDTILFLNDVVFDTEDVLKLLDTNGGEYAAACSLDFSKPPAFYDTFALRDSTGHEAVMPTWPYFQSRVSRHALERGLPVPVTSCWNGMVAMPVDPFLSENPLRFRGLPDSLAASHLEASECCLIHADNPLSTSRPILLNPNVKVGYNRSAYDAVHSKDAIMSPFQIYRAMWENRMRRWLSMSWLRDANIQKSITAWTKVTGESERGGFCAINEMQIIMERGWKHV
ncbi:cryptococcal mannosyltransferase 1-domain-containing protein [Ampelomyces quisqualis]|uniref:Cryptococcal mannosyltransferase 1-domain-containing protein n=1 Tax=Ampelomyces quisqualis TaxID=50730 RepID=A0A6A5QFT5_AMPQU|nr:cryptococcal mannosyltransferase 1-domain-containing protein [Ampelomyces quisqualis]